jgi:hypothetical protein
MDEDPTYEVHWPLGPLAARHGPAIGDAPGLGDLRGKRVAFVAHFGFRPEEMNALLRRELTGSFKGLEFYDFPQFGDIHGPDEAKVLAELPGHLSAREVDGAIVGIAA